VPGGSVVASMGPYFCTASPIFLPRWPYRLNGYCIDSAPPTTKKGRSSSWRTPARIISAPTATASAPLPQMRATVSAGTSAGSPPRHAIPFAA
jgi:hypothetical protein